ncbi:MAG: hypothetical protein PHH11_10565 [Methylomonas sp.]|nr:hypothetical protein [Methylomonas sp.]
MSNGSTSKAIEVMTPNIECDIKRRLLLAGMVGAVGAFSATPLFAQITSPDKTTVSTDGSFELSCKAMKIMKATNFVWS